MSQSWIRNILAPMVATTVLVGSGWIVGSMTTVTSRDFERLTYAVTHSAETIDSLGDTVDAMGDAVDTLDETIDRLLGALDTVEALQAAVDSLEWTVGNLQQALGAVDALQQIVDQRTAPLADLDRRMSNLAACLIALQGAGGADAAASPTGIPDACEPLRAPSPGAGR